MADKQNSHHLADALDALSAKLRAHEPFAMPTYGKVYAFLRYFDTDEKDAFIAAAKAIGGTKKPSDTEYQLEQIIGPLELSLVINRSAVCKLVAPAIPAIYACPSLLSPEEEQALEAQ